jgi:hypothetical protein
MYEEHAPPLSVRTRAPFGHCEEREARRGNLYQTRNAPFHVGLIAVLPAKPSRVQEQRFVKTFIQKQVIKVLTFRKSHDIL